MPLARWPAPDDPRSQGPRRPRLTRRLRDALLALFFALTLLAAGSLAQAASDGLQFARHSLPTRAATLAELREMGAVRTVRVFEPYEAREISFAAIPLPAILDAVYSPSWRAEEELLFTCLDGYQPGVPVARVLRHDAWLAFARGDQEDFSIQKLESGTHRRVELGPFYLVWENLDDPEVKRDGDYGWPYQLAAVDLVRTRDRFPNMVPPGDASSTVHAGFRAFRVHCSRCHKINGDGGSIGQELNHPVSPFDYREREWLVRWISDPSALNATARMPALNRALPERARTIDEILGYLQAMADSRARPEAVGEGLRRAPVDDAGVQSGS